MLPLNPKPSPSWYRTLRDARKRKSVIHPLWRLKKIYTHVKFRPLSKPLHPYISNKPLGLGILLLLTPAKYFAESKSHSLGLENFCNSKRNHISHKTHAYLKETLAHFKAFIKHRDDPLFLEKLLLAPYKEELALYTQEKHKKHILTIRSIFFQDLALLLGDDILVKKSGKHQVFPRKFLVNFITDHPSNLCLELGILNPLLNVPKHPYLVRSKGMVCAGLHPDLFTDQDIQKIFISYLWCKSADCGNKHAFASLKTHLEQSRYSPCLEQSLIYPFRLPNAEYNAVLHKIQGKIPPIGS